MRFTTVFVLIMGKIGYHYLGFQTLERPDETLLKVAQENAGSASETN